MTPSKQQPPAASQEAIASRDLTCTIECGRGSDRMFRIRITEDLSRQIVCEVTLTAEQFGEIIGGISLSGIAFQFFGAENIGLRHEAKRERIPMPYRGVGDTDTFLRKLAQAAKVYEVDGWKADDESAFNQHCWDHAAKTYEVTFRRWVEPVEEASR